MPVSLQGLNDLSLSALHELGNIGAGNAMTAFASMMDARVNMSVPRVGVVRLSDFAEMAGGPESISVGVYMPVTGDAPGHVAFLWPIECAMRLADQLLGSAPGTTQTLGEMECSALVEIGNILASSYLVAVCEMTGLALYSSPPALACDMTAAILGAVASACADTEDEALTVVTQIGESDIAVECYFIYIPEPDSLPILLRALMLDIE